MTKKKTAVWRLLLAGVLALVFLSAGTALAVPNDTASPAAPEVLPVPGQGSPETVLAEEADAALVQAETVDAVSEETWDEPSADGSCVLHFRGTRTRERSAGERILTGISGRVASLTIPAGTTLIDDRAFLNDKDITTVEIPDSVVYIGASAFEGCSNLEEITIPDSVTTMGHGAFSSTGITKLVIGNGLRTIPESAFSQCRMLTDITFGNSVDLLEGWCFSNCNSLEGIVLPDTITYLGDGVFNYCEQLLSVDIPDSVQHMGSSVFSRCLKLYSVSIGSGMDYIPAFTFNGCLKLRNVKFSGREETIGVSAFSGTSNLDTIVLPDSITDIGEEAFSHSGVRVCKTGSGVQTIGRDAFVDCRRLTDLTLGSSLREIGVDAFAGCNELRSVVLPEALISLGGTDGYGVFHNCTALESVTFSGDNLRVVGYNAFNGCSRLQNIVLPDKVRNIEAGAFYGCESLKTIVIPDSVQTMGPNAFAESGLTTISEGMIGSGLTAISSGMFRDCKNLKSVSLGSGITQISSGAFEDCTKLQSVNVGTGVTQIDPYAFRNCTSLTQIAIPDNVVAIGNSNTTGSFDGCKYLKTVTLGATDRLAQSTFDRCENLELIRYTGTQDQWDKLGYILPDGVRLEVNASPIAPPEPLPTATPAAPATLTASPTATATPTETPAATATSTVMPTATARPTAQPTNTAQPTTGPSERPALNVPDIPGYQTGLVGSSTSCVKLSGSSTMFYLRNASGKMERVAVPYIKDSSGKRWYPLNHGGTALFPRLENDKITCYCAFKDGMEVPVVNVAAAPAPVTTGGYQTGTVGGRTYYVKVSGSSMMFYLRNRSGKMERVAVPYIKDSSGKRWYPANHGGSVLFPKLTNGKISYTTGSGETVLLAA